MRPIRWTTEASDQLEAAVKRIQQDNPAAARNVAQAVIDRIEQLATFPGLGRPGDVKGTRELVSPPYVLCTVPPRKLSKSCTSGMVHRTGVERVEHPKPTLPHPHSLQ
ncbi:MAG: type II toxin-antitoxin system RelE/ParE family toxin [Bryobacteraceae bacterium]